MKKTIVLGMAMFLVGCACKGGDCQKKTEVKTDVPAVEDTSTSVAIPCSYSCGQSGKCQSQEPVVLKPRVTETVKSKNKKRFCCEENDDVMPCENEETYVPDAPEIYVISANRTVNSMQVEAEPLFKQVGDVNVYINKATPMADDLPGGMDKGTDTIKKRFSQMENITLVNSKKKADFIVESSADWYDTPTKTIPAIKYNISLKDRSDNLIGEWSEIIHQAEGDRSWW